MNRQLAIEALEDEVEHYKRERDDAYALAGALSKTVQRYHQELRDTREHVMVALDEMRHSGDNYAAVWRLRRCLVSELNEDDAGTEAPASPEPRNLEEQLSDYAQ